MQTYTAEKLLDDVGTIVAKSTHVSINEARLTEVARSLLESPPEKTGYHNDQKEIVSQHFPKNDDDLLQYYFLAVAQYFCIWERDSDTGEPMAWRVNIDGERYVGSPAIDACLLRALKEGVPLLEADYLANLSVDEVVSIFRNRDDGSSSIQMIHERHMKFVEIGSVLKNRYDGHVRNLLKESKNHLYDDGDSGLIQRLMADFPVSYYDWPFCKLAILFPSILSIRRTSDFDCTENYKVLTNFVDEAAFEIAADYYIPFFLIHSGVFNISKSFDDRLRNWNLIERNSQLEREFRAATILAGRMMSEVMGLPLPEVDHLLWYLGFAHARACVKGDLGDVQPCSYSTETSLSDMRWPLVITPFY